MILTTMPVPPQPVRKQSEDDLTYKLGGIIKASAIVRRCEQGAPANGIAEFEQLFSGK
jgi:DNA-directed RNA polymerase II subunit RPB1